MPRKPALLLSLLNLMLRPIGGEASANQFIAPSQQPLPTDREAWRTYWQTQDQPWRTEPEIDQERQAELAKCRAITPNIEKGVYPFKNVKLSRADVEWLLATHEKGRMGLDLRGADLQFVNLSGLPLAKLRGGLFGEEWLRGTADQRRMAAIHLESANLRGSNLAGSALSYAHLEGASLREAHLEGADLYLVHFEGKQLPLSGLQPFPGKGEKLRSADLRNAFFSAATKLDRMLICDEKGVSISVEGVRWGDVNVTNVEWISVKMLGDEYEARQSVDRNGKVKPKNRQERDYDRAVQANRQLASILQAQGMNEESARFTYRAQNLQRVLFWRRKKVGAWLFSWFLFLLAGYGYKLWRSFLAYLVVIIGFTTLYYLLGASFKPSLSLVNALGLSMTSFHGRGFFPGVTQLNDTLTILASLEAFVGLILEATFIATLTQRFFGR